jgi:hypothetical protein
VQLETFDSKKIDKQHWNTLVASLPEGIVFQTSFWADFLEEYMLYKPMYFYVKDRDETKAICLGFTIAYNHYGYFEKPILHRLLPLGRNLFPSFMCQEGILVFEDDEQKKREITQYFLNEIILFCKKNRIVNIHLLTLPILGPSQTLLDNDCSLKKKKWATYLVNLQQSMDSAWKNMEHSARKAINKALKDGILVERVKDEVQLRVIYDFNREEILKKGHRVYSYDNHRIMWKHLKKGNCVEQFVAYHEGRIIGSLGIWHYNGTLYEFASVQSEYAYENKLYGSDAIKWEIIKWGIQNGYRWYNLAGVNPEPKTPKEEGIRRFKEKWGGEYREYFEYNLEFGNNVLFKVLKSGWRIFKGARRES